MNSHREWESASTFYHSRQEQSNALSNFQKTLTTLVLLALGYWILNLLDAWPSTIKRRTYEIIIYLIPSQAIYVLQAVMARFSRLSHEDLRFRRADFGNPHAKAEALHRMLGHGTFPQAIRKVRSMSGVDSILPASQETGPPGLGNWDNSCYQNSVLQGLASLPEFQKYIDESLQTCDSIVAPASTHRALRPFLGRLSDTTSPKQVLWTPAVLKSMDSWNQQDAQEYFTKVLDAVEKEAFKYAPVLQKRATPGLEALPDSMSKEEEATSLLERISLNESATTTDPSQQRAQNEDSPETCHKFYSKSAASLPYKCPVDGMLAQALECQTCGFSEGFSLTQFNCLTLNLGLRSHSYLEELLDDYTEPEMVDGVECTECTKAASDKAEKEETGQDKGADQPSPKKRPKLKPVLRTKAKQITLGRLPNDLVIHINRSIFDDFGNQRKNMSLIQYPARLAISSKWCAPLGDEDEHEHIVATYELKCAVTHYGRHENGHYVAFGKRDKDWYAFNDEVVQKLAEEEVLSRGNVFMLFYEAVEARPANEDEQVPESAKASRRVEAQDSSTGSSSSEAEAISPPGPVTPIPKVPVLRTASGSIKPEQSPLGNPPVVSAL